MAKREKYWLDHPQNVNKLLIGLYVSCAFLLVIDLFYHRHAILKLEESFGFYGIYGFVACVILVLVAKEMRKLISRPEDYYEDGNDT